MKQIVGTVRRLFDSHLHIIDPRFPLVPNNGYLPNAFTVEDYRARVKALPVVGGAVVSGSFQAFDQNYLVAALEILGQGFVGVTQLPADTPNDRILALDQAGVRAVRFNLKRGGSEKVEALDSFARRVFDVAGWHAELYVDASDLPELRDTVLSLPAVSVDHLGLSAEGFKTLLELAEQGIRVKATGFGRVDFGVEEALKDLYAANPQALMFGTDLPSTRAPRPFRDEDVTLIIEALGEAAANEVFYSNAARFYRLESG